MVQIKTTRSERRHDLLGLSDDELAYLETLAGSVPTDVDNVTRLKASGAGALHHALRDAVESYGIADRVEFTISRVDKIAVFNGLTAPVVTSAWHLVQSLARMKTEQEYCDDGMSGDDACMTLSQTILKAREIVARAAPWR